MFVVRCQWTCVHDIQGTVNDITGGKSVKSLARRGRRSSTSPGVVVLQHHLVVDVAHPPLDGQREDALAVVVVVVVVLSSRTASTSSSSRVIWIRDVKRSSNFRTSILKFEFEFDLHTFGIRSSEWNLDRDALPVSRTLRYKLLI